MASREPDEGREEAWFFAGPGVTNALARSVAWERTPVGPWREWPTGLKAALGMLFHARQPMFVWWGPELVQFYNDAYLPSFGGSGKHPAAMGQRGRDCWQEIWPIIWPQIDDVMSRGVACWNEDRLVPILRNGRIEEVYWTYSYGPVYADDGRVGGTLVVCTETTARVVAERRMRMLRELADRTSLAYDLPTLMARAAEVIARFAADIPCAALFAEDGASGRLVLAGRAGALAEALPEQALPTALGADASAGRLLPLADLTGPGVVVPGGPWPEAVEQVWLASFSGPEARPTGALLLGVSPRLGFDDAYRHFFAQIFEHLGVAATRIEADLARLAVQRERDNLLMQAPVGTALLTGPRHVFALANPIYCQIVGRRDLVGKTYLGAFPELADTAMPGILDHVYTTGESYVTEELKIFLDIDNKGKLEERYFKFAIEALREGGAIYGMMAVAVDITAQALARRTLERASAEREKLLAALEAANRTKDEFLAMLGHELRNPLAPIVTALQLIKLQGDSASREYRIIERQVTHVVRLVDDLLDVSRITRGQIELRREPTEVAEIVHKAIEMASHLLEKRGHTLTVDCADQRMLCDGDPVRLAQVIANLLTNAARYTEPGGHIQLEAHREGETIVVSVADDGIGIAPEMLPRVFDLFVQGKRGSDRFEGGLGIGLALVKSLVALHGGTVTAHSDGPGRGSEFVVRVPAAPAEVAAPVEPAAPAGKSSGRVLVVDDNIDAAEILGDMLGEFGYEVALAHDGLAALEQVQRFRPDAAILDIGLPVIDGYELATRIRADPQNVECRLIALSGYGQESDRQRSREAGFECHLVKPVDIERIVAVLEDGATAR
jgi:signal transduction histidine kinase/CheY-like chemotaxis protein